MNSQAQAAFAESNTDKQAAQRLTQQADELQSHQLYQTVPTIVLKWEREDFTTSTTTLVCDHVNGGEIEVGVCHDVTKKETTSYWKLVPVHGSKTVKNQSVATEISQFEDSARQDDIAASADSTKGSTLTRKADTLHGEWETTREEASIAAGEASQASAYASDESARAKQLFQIAGADQTAAQEAEDEYVSLEEAYQQQQKDGSTAHPRTPDRTKNPPAPNPPDKPTTPPAPPPTLTNTTPPAPQGPETLTTPVGDQGPIIDPGIGDGDESPLFDDWPFRVPAEKGPSSGILITPGGETPLESGYNGPAADIPKGTSGFNRLTRGHVEGHAAAIMRQQGLDEATLKIDRPPCLYEPGCENMLPRMLPEGDQLRVVAPGGFEKTYTGVPDP